ncbi:MAG: GxxExxY protein, partial [Phycisphaerales bacterium]|nr:GxxExxY protein [Phycisphaerales bacterium]
MESPSTPPTAAQNGRSSPTEVTEEKQGGPEINEITKRIIGCGFRVHTALGPGLFERTYQVCMVHELKKIGMLVEAEVVLPVVYDGIKIDAAYRVDLRVEKKVLVEIKAVDALTDVHQAQLLTYLQLSGIRVGLLLNFNVVHLIDGI